MFFTERQSTELLYSPRVIRSASTWCILMCSILCFPFGLKISAILASMLDGCRRGGRDGLEASLAQRAVHEREDADDEDDPEDRERGA